MISSIKIFFATLKYRLDARYTFNYINNRLVITDSYYGSFGEDFIVYDSNEVRR